MLVKKHKGGKSNGKNEATTRRYRFGFSEFVYGYVVGDDT
jgi:hypothetical protein